MLSCRVSFSYLVLSLFEASTWACSQVGNGRGTHLLTLTTVGSGFVRVPYPRRFDMPASKAIDDDPEEGEIYSLSMLHQLHCLVRKSHSFPSSSSSQPFSQPPFHSTLRTIHHITSRQPACLHRTPPFQK